MKRMRYLEGMIFGTVLLMRVLGVISLKTCGIICLLILCITVISERQYYISYKKPWIDILSRYYFIKHLKIEKNKIYFTGGDKIEFIANETFMRNHGKCILEEGEKIINNPKIAIERRNEVKGIMEEVRSILETEKLL